LRSDGNTKGINGSTEISTNDLQSDHEHGADKADEADGADGADRTDEVDGGRWSRFDHAILSFGLPAEDFFRKLQPARKLLAPTDRIGAVFFQNHIRPWQEAVQSRMLPALKETDGDALMAMQQAEKRPSGFLATHGVLRAVENSILRT